MNRGPGTASSPEVNEDILINNVRSHVSKILNKVAVNTLETRDGSGRLECDFQMSEIIQGGLSTYHLKEDYHSQFWRDGGGTSQLTPGYYMPVVRNVPRFPAGPWGPGDTWTAEAEEVHDLRRGYGYWTRFISRSGSIYLSAERGAGRRQCAVLRVEYNTFHAVPMPARRRWPCRKRSPGGRPRPGTWDIAAGTMHSYDEEFDFIFFLTNGSTWNTGGLPRPALPIAGA